MMEKLNNRSLWHLVVRGALYRRCFCIYDNEYADWLSLPHIPGLYDSEYGSLLLCNILYSNINNFSFYVMSYNREISLKAGSMQY
uniref:Uncharacterized protein n=1 Tax=Nelumbo nucifera TaxID=4432 RepID=A0A822YK21_NELNU|nr:TPA_asm: hypothetical protein HUJ06_011314 [Nelumbo nucifera]